MDNKKKLSQEAAFANSYDEETGKLDEYGNNKFKRHNEMGMSKRFYAACAAMQGIISSNNTEYLVNGSNEGWHEPISIVKTAYQFADELLKQEDL